MAQPEKLSELTQAACFACKEIGAVLKKGFGENFTIYPKGENYDLVTSFDHLAEKMAVEILEKKFPKHSFMCEERGKYNYREGNLCWFIDPLDGTVNFAHNIPLFCVSIAAVFNGESLAGAIFVPMLDELFYAEKGNGAFLNGRPLQVSSKASLSICCLATSLSFNLHQQQGHTIQLFSHMANLGLPLRSFGSTAMTLAYIAAGRIDGFWSVGGSLNAWDLAAGKLLIEEAGGKITNCKGDPFQLTRDRQVLASNGLIHERLVHELSHYC